jgi:hypothetical protein
VILAWGSEIVCVFIDARTWGRRCGAVGNNTKRPISQCHEPRKGTYNRLYEKYHILVLIPVGKVSLSLGKRNENIQDILQGNKKILEDDK